MEPDEWNGRALLMRALIGTVADLERKDVQPTARQVSMALGLYDGGAKSMLLSAVADGLLIAKREWIERAKGEFTVYRLNPAVRVQP